MTSAQKITVQTTIQAPMEKIWEYWTNPEHVMQWNAASDDWHTPNGTNDLRVGGQFSFHMEAKDQSAGFDFGGTYTDIEHQAKIAYKMEDGREVTITFEQKGDTTTITETFDAENENSPEIQGQGWQAILDNFKKYVENT